MRRPDPALAVVLAGISAALHLGKLSPALPVLRATLHVSLVHAGFLLSAVQVAGMLLGVAIGAAADSIGPRRTMVSGLVILCVASLLGGFTSTPAGLLALRCAEGMGFLLTTLPGPGLIRRLVPPERLSRVLGLWGAYMPFGTGAALLFGPGFIAWIGWPGWWWLLALLSLAMAGVLWVSVPVLADRRVAPAASGAGFRSRIVRTLRSRGPWLASLAFAVYSAQWLAVVGFLPTIYAQAGFPVAYAAFATALAAAVNIVGNIASGRLLQRGVPATVLLQCGYAAMIVGAIVAFAGWGEGGAAVAGTRYAGVLLFSAVGGLVPGTLFSLAVRVAPDEGTVSTTVGWMQQGSALGQFAGPPLAGWVAARAGGWQATCWVTGAFALAGMGIAAAMARFLAGPEQRARAVPRGSP